MIYINKAVKVLINLSLFLLSGIVFLGILELLLSSGFFDNLNNPNPVWIPPKYKEINRIIQDKNERFSMAHPYRFNDEIRSIEKNVGDKRVAVLGDSFIWGGALSYEDVWTHKLENKFEKDLSNIEVLSWGYPGWNTADQYKFLKKFGADYNIDYLLVAFVTNDPDLNNTHREKFSYHKLPIFQNFEKRLPLAFSFLSSYINKFLSDYFFDEYNAILWEDNLYKAENLSEYAKQLRDLADLCKENDIKLFFVLTPQGSHESIQHKFNKIANLLDSINIDYLDLFPYVQKKYGKSNPRKLWANLADSHPGVLLNELFAEEVYKYISKRLISSNPSKKTSSALMQTSPLEGISQKSFPVFCRIFWFNNEKNTGKKDAILIDAAENNGRLLIKGIAVDNSKDKQMGDICIIIDQKYFFRTYYGPSFEVQKLIPEEVKFLRIPKSERFFKAHIPVKTIGKGEHTVSVAIISQDRQSFHSLNQEILITIK